jgi:hypothetical protein
MKKLLTTFIFFSCFIASSQTEEKTTNSSLILTPEFMVGISAEANENFPERNPQVQTILNIGWDTKNNSQEWTKQLKKPRTGVSLGYTNFGNNDSIGSAITLMPFIEFNAFKREKLKLLVGTGASYFTKKLNSETNPNNKAITTDIVWSFRLFMYYNFLKTKKIDWRIGAGYFHHSNGHTRLPNQGLNSFLVSLSADIKRNNDFKELTEPHDNDKNIYDYLDVRTGFGINVLGKPNPFNEQKGVYTLALNYGKVYNKTYKIGGGLYYRYYQHYYDYINNNESLVQEGREFNYLRANPFWNASAFGVFVNGEILLNHVGIDLQLAFNIHKPAYKIDWRINQGWEFVPREIPEDSNIVLGEFDTKYKLKQYISARMGLKYYLIGTNKVPKHNIYLGIHINSNLGQADFTEASLGYIYSFNK